MKPTIVEPAAWKQAAELFSAVIDPVSVHVISSLEKQRGLTIREMVTQDFNYNRILKTTQKLEAVRVIRKDKLGNEVSYILDYDRLRNINQSAAQLIGYRPLRAV